MMQVTMPAGFIYLAPVVPHGMSADGARMGRLRLGRFRPVRTQWRRAEIRKKLLVQPINGAHQLRTAVVLVSVHEFVPRLSAC